MTTTVGRIYYIFLGIDDGLESYMQFVISCEGFVQFEFLSRDGLGDVTGKTGKSQKNIFL
jgi:hypothetical protein